MQKYPRLPRSMYVQHIETVKQSGPWTGLGIWAHAQDGYWETVDNKNDSDISWKNIVDVVTEAGEKILGKRSKNTKKYRLMVICATQRNATQHEFILVICATQRNATGIYIGNLRNATQRNRNWYNMLKLLEIKTDKGK